MNHHPRALGLLAQLAHGLVRHGDVKTKRDLGDRSTYVGLSDVGRAITCRRAAVVSKLNLPTPNLSILDTLRRQLVLQRGHWLEAGLEAAFRANDANLIPQLEINAPGAIPLRAHVDFIFVGNTVPPSIRILELKSTEHLPKTLYAGYEAQIYGQVGLLAELWNQPVFTLGDLKERTFPQLCRHLFGLSLPDSPDGIDLEGWVLCLSMSDARAFGPYPPNASMLKLCRLTARSLWQGVQAVKAGRIDVNDLETCRGFHPLCEWCDHISDCPKFKADPLNDPVLDDELAEFYRLKTQKNALEREIHAREGRIRQFCRHADSYTGWLSTANFRFKNASCAGRKTIDTDHLRTALINRIGTPETDSLFLAATTVGADYQRLTVTPLKDFSS